VNLIPSGASNPWAQVARKNQSKGESMSTLQTQPRITPFLWFDSNAEEAVAFYTGIFPNSRIVNELRNTESTPGAVGSILTIEFELDGLRLIALNGGPAFKFTEAISLAVVCDNQQEIDNYWSKLTAGGSEVQCGWLKDKFGLSWQVVPRNFASLLKTDNAMKAMMAMKKFDIAQLEAASKS
jgi:predicted 3-demethylubiquinone-9 3-methyltransferase (glyoxalase superfamily)